jgi:hypothetical protein
MASWVGCPNVGWWQQGLADRGRDVAAITKALMSAKSHSCPWGGGLRVTSHPAIPSRVVPSRAAWGRSWKGLLAVRIVDELWVLVMGKRVAAWGPGRGLETGRCAALFTCEGRGRSEAGKWQQDGGKGEENRGGRRD